MRHKQKKRTIIVTMPGGIFQSRSQRSNGSIMKNMTRRSEHMKPTQQKRSNMNIKLMKIRITIKIDTRKKL